MNCNNTIYIICVRRGSQFIVVRDFYICHVSETLICIADVCKIVAFANGFYKEERYTILRDIDICVLWVSFTSRWIERGLDHFNIISFAVWYISIKCKCNRTTVTKGCENQCVSAFRFAKRFRRIRAIQSYCTTIAGRSLNVFHRFSCITLTSVNSRDRSTSVDRFNTVHVKSISSCTDIIVGYTDGDNVIQSGWCDIYSTITTNCSSR